MRALRFFQVFAFVACVLLAFHAAPVFAQATPPGGAPTPVGQVTPPPNPVDNGALVNGKANFNDVLTEFYNASSHWQTSLGHYAIRLFWLLAFIELVWTASKLALRGSDLQEWVTEVVKYVLFVGFFAALLTYAPEWCKAIIDSFNIAASNASAAGGGHPTTPSDIFAMGIDTASQLYAQQSVWHPGKDAGIMIAALIIVLLFAAIAAMLVLAWIETYFVIYAAIIFTGFGGSRFTSDYAKRVLMLAVTAGTKLFVLLLVAGLLQTLAQKWANAAAAGTNPAIMSLIGVSLLGAFLCVRIPSMIGSITSGQVASSSGLIAVAASLATAAAGLGVATKGLQAASRGMLKGVQGAHGAGMAMSAASSLAGAQTAASNYQPQTMAARGLTHMTRTLANLGQSAAQNLGGPMSGRSAFSARSANNGQGNLGSRMADSMTAKKADLTKPKAPDGGSTPPAGGDAGTGSVRGTGNAATAAPSPREPDKAPTGAGEPTAAGGSEATSTPKNETDHGRQKRAEFQEALRHFGNRIKAHNAGD